MTNLPPRNPYWQVKPTFAFGRVPEVKGTRPAWQYTQVDGNARGSMQRYHNMGQLQTPYVKKPDGTLGDYGPVQTARRYYTHKNRNYVYPLDKDVGYHVGAYETQYPEVFAPETAGSYYHGVQGKTLSGKIPTPQPTSRFHRQPTRP